MRGKDNIRKILISRRKIITRGEDSIRKALISMGWTKGETNAAYIWYGEAHYNSHHDSEWYGWHIKPFDKTPYFLGYNIEEVLQMLYNMRG